MWKNGKEGRRIMEGTEGIGRGETIEAEEKAEEKTEPRKGGMRQAREGVRWDRKEKESGERGAAGTSSGKQSGRKQNNCGMA